MRFHALWPDGRPLIDLEKAVVLGGGRVKALTNRAKQLERFAARSFSPEETDQAWKPAGAVQYLALSRHFYGWLEELVAALGDAGCPPSTPGSWLSRKDGTEAAGVGN